MSYMLANTNGDTYTQVPMIPLLCPVEIKDTKILNTLADHGFSKICNDRSMFRNVLLMEVITTFVFVNVVLSVKYHSSSSD